MRILSLEPSPEPPAERCDVGDSIKVWPGFSSQVDSLQPSCQRPPNVRVQIVAHHQRVFRASTERFAGEGEDTRVGFAYADILIARNQDVLEVGLEAQRPDYSPLTVGVRVGDERQRQVMGLTKNSKTSTAPGKGSTCAA